MNTPAPRECEIPECSLSRYHEGMHEDIDGRVVGPCAARRPGYDTGLCGDVGPTPCATGDTTDRTGTRSRTVE